MNAAPMTEREYVRRMLRSRNHHLFMAGRARQEVAHHEKVVGEIDALIAPFNGPRPTGGSAA